MSDLYVFLHRNIDQVSVFIKSCTIDPYLLYSLNLSGGAKVSTGD